MTKRRRLPWVIVAGAALAGLLLIFLRPGAASSPPAGVCTDEDHDGFGLGCLRGPDCNDRDPAMHPRAQEICNFKDDDCDGAVDDVAGCPAPEPQPGRVPVPAGRFLMGSSAGAADEQPVHQVSGPAFELDRHEVTNARYADCVFAGACSLPTLTSSNRRTQYFGQAEFAAYPVVHVSWSQAAAFCAWAGGRLPSEAEWERAGRGTADGRVFPWGDSAPDCSKANFAGCVGDTDLVGRRPAGASPYGALDMAGNVWEWTADWYDAGFYGRSPTEDPRGPETGNLKVMRGGCWVSGASSLRTTCRKAELPATWAPNVGFRCAYAVR